MTLQQLVNRLTRLGTTPADLGIGDEWEILQDSIERGRPDEILFEIISEQLDSLEQQLISSPFLHPTTPLDDGKIELGTTTRGEPVRISIGNQ